MFKRRRKQPEQPQLPLPNPFEALGRTVVNTALLTTPDTDPDSLGIVALDLSTKEVFASGSRPDGLPTLDDLEIVKRLLAEGHVLHAALAGTVVKIIPLAVTPPGSSDIPVPL